MNLLLFGLLLSGVWLMVSSDVACDRGQYNHHGECKICVQCPNFNLDNWLKDECKTANVVCPKWCRLPSAEWSLDEELDESICHPRTNEPTTTPSIPTNRSFTPPKITNDVTTSKVNIVVEDTTSEPPSYMINTSGASIKRNAASTSDNEEFSLSPGYIIAIACVVGFVCLLGLAGVYYLYHPCTSKTEQQSQYAALDLEASLTDRTVHVLMSNVPTGSVIADAKLCNCMNNVGYELSSSGTQLTFSLDSSDSEFISSMVELPISVCIQHPDSSDNIHWVGTTLKVEGRVPVDDECIEQRDSHETDLFKKLSHFLNPDDINCKPICKRLLAICNAQPAKDLFDREMCDFLLKYKTGEEFGKNFLEVFNTVKSELGMDIWCIFRKLIATTSLEKLLREPISQCILQVHKCTFCRTHFHKVLHENHDEHHVQNETVNDSRGENIPFLPI